MVARLPLVRSVIGLLGRRSKRKAILMQDWAVLIGALFLTSCTVTTAPNPNRVTELIPGVSTKDDAIAKLGPPDSVLNAENQTILQWGSPQSPVHLAISF